MTKTKRRILGKSRQIVLKLSKMENEIMELSASGLIMKQIAAKLGISGRTVQTHFDRIRYKLNADTTVQAMYNWCKGIADND